MNRTLKLVSLALMFALAACSAGSVGPADGTDGADNGDEPAGDDTGPGATRNGGPAGSSSSGSSGATKPAPVTPSASTGSIDEVKDFGSNPGALKMYVYVPTKVAERPAVVVALHGCTQSAKDYVNAGWNDLAEAWGFYVVYPEQQMANNMNRCFNWYEGAEIKRAGGEPTSIVQMVDKAKATYGATRAFVTGLSAGAAMTAVMLATYPDVFEAGSIDAGLPYACATSMTQAYTCMGGNTKKTADAWGDLVRQAFAGAAAPRVQIWQGSADYTVRPGNLTELGKQWTNVAGTDDKADETTSVGPATRKRYKNATGTTLVETFEIPNMGHGTAIKSQGEGGVACGKPGAYILESGICSTYHAGTFFGLQP